MEPNQENGAYDQHCQEYIIGFLGFGWLIIPFGFVGNSLTILVMNQTWHKSATQLLFSYLALADTLTLAAYCAHVLINPMLKLTGHMRESNNLRAVAIAYITNTSIIFNQTSVLMTVLVAWQRYLSICYPHSARRYSSHKFIHVASSSAFFVAVIFYIPNYFMYRLDTSNGTYSLWLADFAKLPAFTIFYTVVLSYLVSYVIPIALLTFMAFGLMRATWKNSKKSSSNNMEKAKHELTLSVIIVIFIFIICQSFGPVRHILKWVYDPYLVAITCGGSLFYFGPFPVFFQVINSSVNFVVYVVCATGFRRNLKKLFTRKGWGPCTQKSSDLMDGVGFSTSQVASALP